MLVKGKRGQFESALLAVVTIFIIGIILLFMNHLNDKIFGSFDDWLDESEDLKGSYAQNVTQDIQDVDNAAWDWGFFAIFIGLILNMVFFAFATRINIAFYWIFSILGIVILIVGTILSNIWQEIASNPEFAETILRFPITNMLLGSYFPTVVVALMFIMMIYLFGKPPTGSLE